MTNPLRASRDAFAAAYPEERVHLGGRDWGLVDLAGPGPVLLLIPGTLGRADIFWQQMAALQGRARILSVSYPATGGVADWAGDLIALMDARGLGQATVLGSSLGGYLAQYMAASHPDRVTQVIAANTLCDVAPARQRPPYDQDLDAAPIEALQAGFGRGLSAWADAHPDQRDLVDLLLAEIAGRIPAPELRSRLKGIKDAPPLAAVPLDPARIVTIEALDDPLIPAPMRAAVRDRLRPGTSYIFETGGHFPYIARPALYTALLEEQLGLVPPGTTPWGNAGVRSA